MRGHLFSLALAAGLLAWGGPGLAQGSPSPKPADLLLARAGEALREKDAALSVELLDRVTQLAPGWAEAWMRRAAAFWQLDDPSRALMDVEEALVREPRHFTAWMMLGHIALSSGDKAGALAAYRRALGIHPFLEEAEKAVKRLAPEVDGRDL